MAKRNKTKSARPLLKLEALEQRQLLAGGFTTEQGQEFSNIVHANGNVYDQVLLKSSAITITNDPGQITRVSFLDLQGDIVQAEFSGAGQLSISLDNFSGPAEAAKYNQPGVKYVSGLASFTIQGSDATTNFSVFSVGSGTANGGKDSPLFSTGLTGGNNTADVARLTVVANPANPNGSTFGGIRAGNAVFGGSEGPVGISAANVQVQNVVTIGDIDASGTATPTLVFGTQSQFGAVNIAGGDLVASNGKAVNNTGSYAYGINLTAGTTSGGTAIAAADPSAAGSFTGSNPFNATANSFTLTTGVDTIPGLAGTAGIGNGGNDTINGTVGNGASSTLTALDSINGGKGTDTLVILDLGNNNGIPAGVTLSSVETVNLRSAGGATISTSTFSDVTTLNVTQGTSANVTAAKTTAVSISGITGAVVADGGSTMTVTTQAGDVTVGGTTAPAGVITVTDTKQGATDVVIDGGTDVSVTTTGAGAGGTINVGATTQPSGMITINSTGAAYDATAGSLSLGTITTKGGTTVNVTQVAASSSADAATDTTSATITQSAVSITGTKATTSVSVTQSAPVNQVDYVAAAGSKEVSEVTFVAMTAGQTATVEGLTFTAAKALTADQAAAAFANLAASAGQGSSAASLGVYSGTASANFVSGAASGAKVTFTGASNGNLAIALAGTAAPSVTTNTDGAATVTTTAGVMGVAGGMVAVADSTDKTIATVSLSGFSAKERVVVTLAGAPVNGDTLVFDGATTFYVDSTPTLAELITAAAGKTYTNWIVAGNNDTTITFERKTSGTVVDVAAGDFTGTAKTASGITTTPVTIVQGSGASTVTSDALSSLSLSKSNGDVTITNATATTLGLTVNGVGTSTSNAGGVSTGATYTTLNLNSAGASWVALNAPGVTTLNVSGSAATNVGSTVTGETSTLTALTTVTVTGTAGLTLGTNGRDTITSLDASGTTGAVSVTLKGDVGTFTGGSGADTLTINTSTVAKAVSMGAGNDTVNLASGTTTLGAVIDGGAGTADTIKFGAVADAATASLSNSMATSFTNFEKVSLPTSTTTSTVNLDNLNAINYVVFAGQGAKEKFTVTFAGTTPANGDTLIFDGVTTTYADATPTLAEFIAAAASKTYTNWNVSSSTATTIVFENKNFATVVDVVNGDFTGTAIGVTGTTATAAAPSTQGATGALTLTNMANNGTLELTAAGLGAVVTMKDATGSADTLNVVTTNGSSASFGTVQADGVETIKLTVTDTTTSTVDTHTLTIKDDSLTTLTIAGTAKLNLSMDATTAKVTLIDGSAMTTALTVTGGTSVAQTIKGGTAADTITAGYNGDTLQGGAGGDTLSANGKSLVTLTGGAGADTFNVSTPTNNVNSYATITDLEASDKIKFGTAGTPAFKAAAIVLDPTTAVFQDYANAAIAANARGDISWFQFSGNTYIVQDQDAAQLNSFQNNSDIIVKISGLKDLSTASFNSTSATLLIV